jgi:hypothetical protein
MTTNMLAGRIRNLLIKKEGTNEANQGNSGEDYLHVIYKRKVQMEI